MLIPKEMLIRATELSLSEVKAALWSNGYTDNKDLCGVEFNGMTTCGAFVYGITYDDGEEFSSPGTVYIKIEKRNLSKDFKFYADY